MVSVTDRARRGGLVVAGTLLSAALFWFGTGLHPVAALTWLAPIPVLLLAPRVSGLTASAAAFVAFLIGGLDMARYEYATIEVPLLLVAGIAVLFAGGFAALVAVSRLLWLRGRVGLAVLATPAGWASLEYVVAVLSPHGAFISIGYTQVGDLPVLQVASVTGVWGVSFLLMGGATAVAALAAPGVAVRRRVRLGAAMVVVGGLVVGYGLVALNVDASTGASAAGPTRTVSVVAISTDDERVEVGSAEGRALLDEYVARVSAAVARGARVVVLPEKVFAVDRSRLADQLRPLRDIATRRHIDLVLGAGLRQGREIYNVAIGFPSDGSAPVISRKHHLIPGLEDGMRPGTGAGSLSRAGQHWTLLVCKDLDYPSLVRRDVAAGADLLLVPAWDFDEDGWLHSRMAIMRGVEDGVPMVRSARTGRLTVSDAHGRVLGEDVARDRPATVTTRLTIQPVSTLYRAWGDWFAWLCLAISTVALFGLRRRRPRR